MNTPKITKLIMGIALVAMLIPGALFADDNKYKGTWTGRGEGSVTWGIYKIEVFAEWEMEVAWDGSITGEWWAGSSAYGNIYGDVNDTTDYGHGTWDVDNPIGCPLHGTWVASYYTCEGGYCMSGSWYYYNLLGQKVRGGPIRGSSPKSGIPE